jgi:hypothetical protein
MIPVEKTAENAERGLAPDPAGRTDSSRKPARNRISMSVINFWLDAVLLAVFVSLGGISAVLRLVFPPPTTADGWKLWGWGYDQWSDLQFGCLCVLGLLVVLHVMLHWNWVCSVVMAQILRSRDRIDDSMQTIYGVGLLISLLLLLLAGVIAAMSGVRKPPM